MQKLATLGYKKYGDEEGHVILDLQFFSMPIVMQQDIVSDWIADLQTLQMHLTMASCFETEKILTKEKKNAAANAK